MILEVFLTLRWIAAVGKFIKGVQSRFGLNSIIVYMATDIQLFMDEVVLMHKI